ncbi:hypothetical protein F9B16_48290, partial [Actinomadura montaniterrae]
FAWPFAFACSPAHAGGGAAPAPFAPAPFAPAPLVPAPLAPAPFAAPLPVGRAGMPPVGV